MDLGLRGRTAVVTGASKGIGRAVAEELAREGCTPVLIARTGAAVEAAARDIAARHGVPARGIALDLSTSAGQAAAFAACPTADILVNNAGAIASAELDEVSEEQWMAGWNLKLFAYVNLTRHYWRAMKARRAGVIVNVIGTGGERVDARTIAASTANAALIAFTRAMGARGPDFGVRVMGVNPAGTATDRLVSLYRHRAERELGDPERWRELTQALPFGRPAEPQEVAWTVAFLASDRASYLSGSVVNVDAGKAAKP